MPYKVMLYSREQKLLYCAETRERKRKLQSTGGQRSMDAQQARALICQGCGISRYSSASVRRQCETSLLCTISNAHCSGGRFTSYEPQLHIPRLGVDIAAPGRGIFLTMASSSLLSFHFPDVLGAISLEQDPVINQGHKDSNAEVFCNVMARSEPWVGTESSQGRPQRSSSTSISEALTSLGEQPSPYRQISVSAWEGTCVLLGFKREKEGSKCCSCAVWEWAPSHKPLPVCKPYLPGMVCGHLPPGFLPLSPGH